MVEALQPRSARRPQPLFKGFQLPDSPLAARKNGLRSTVTEASTTASAKFDLNGSVIPVVIRWGRLGREAAVGAVRG